MKRGKKLRTDYLGIHDPQYRRLKADGQTSWSAPDDVATCLRFYLSVLSPPGDVLILGCGDGETAIALAAQRFTVTGLDISPTAIEWAQEKARERNVRADFRIADLAAPGLAIGSFDTAIDDHCFHCIIGPDHRGSFLANVSGNLKTGGRFILRTQCGDPPASSPAAFRQSWDPATRCQVRDGLAGRYFGLPDSIMAEIRDAGFQERQSRVTPDEDGWQMLEAVFSR